MSLARQLLHDFRPFFRVLDEPLRSSIALRSRSLFDEPFGPSFPFARQLMRGPAVDISEAPNSYVVEAELPGVKRENIEVRIGDGGRSVTIEGKLLDSQPTESTKETTHNEATSVDKSTQLSTERSITGTFSRTLTLPRPIDPNTVVAKLEDGVLQITLSKAEDQASVVVPVN
ncbi:SHSP domain-containing protein [Mycena indigotica]|uniref:SHSP domain-containing protein n=1 Tax=Mycena indigotica TaxID=2126181 RepID=A0A8H6W4K5_9AGAR|nr:SHSP domain-containing protein [Mycena indigotica]KAF7299034.1 SHSP domain-containing protein [Mycena indigotica]